MSTPPPPPPPGYGPGGSDWSGYGQAAANQPPVAPGYGYGYGYRPPQDHPKATTALVLGILSLVVCQILGPFALVIGRNAVKEIDASGGTLGGRGQATAGWICGLIATILIAVWVVIVVLFVVIAAVSSTSTSSSILLR